MTTTKAKAEPMQGLAEWLREQAAGSAPILGNRLHLWADAVDRSQFAGQDAGMVPAKWIPLKRDTVTGEIIRGESAAPSAAGSEGADTIVHLADHGMPPPVWEGPAALIAATPCLSDEDRSFALEMVTQYGGDVGEDQTVMSNERLVDMMTVLGYRRRPTPAPKGKGVADTPPQPWKGLVEWLEYQARHGEFNGFHRSQIGRWSSDLRQLTMVPDFDVSFLANRMRRLCRATDTPFDTDWSDATMVGCAGTLIGTALGNMQRAALAAQPVQEVVAPALVPAQKRLIGWRMADYTEETSDPAMAKNWSHHVDVQPVFEGDPNTRLTGIVPPEEKAS